MEFISLFTRFSGRAGRGGFWLGIFVLLLAGGAATWQVMTALIAGDPMAAINEFSSQLSITQQLTYLVLLFPLVALITKRLHDRNKSGLLAALIWVPALLKLGQTYLAGFSGGGFWIEQAINWLPGLLTAQLAAVGIWFFIELGFYGGTRGENRFGPDPRDD